MAILSQADIEVILDALIDRFLRRDPSTQTPAQTVFGSCLIVDDCHPAGPSVEIDNCHSAEDVFTSVDAFCHP